MHLLLTRVPGGGQLSRGRYTYALRLRTSSEPLRASIDVAEGDSVNVALVGNTRGHEGQAVLLRSLANESALHVLGVLDVPYPKEN